MRLVHIHETGGDYHAAAIVARDGRESVVPLQQADPSLPRTIDNLLQLGEAGVAAAADAVRRYRGEAAPLTDVKLIPPVVRPQKILCVGLNYADHAAETGALVGDEPVIFNKLPSTLRVPIDPI